MGDIGANFSRILRARGPLAVALSIVALYAPVDLVGGPIHSRAFYETFALSRQGVSSGMLWQLGSYGFLHGNWLHAGLNALMIWVLGAQVAHVVGNTRFLAACAWGLLGGAIGHLALGSQHLVGFSGAAMALLLVITSLSPESRMFPLPVSGRSLGLGMTLASGILALANPAAGMPLLAAAGEWLTRHGMGAWFTVGHACHLGGCLAGWLYARRIMGPTITLKQLRRARARRERE